MGWRLLHLLRKRDRSAFLISLNQSNCITNLPLGSTTETEVWSLVLGSAKGKLCTWHAGLLARNEIIDFDLLYGCPSVICLAWNRQMTLHRRKSRFLSDWLPKRQEEFTSSQRFQWSIQTSAIIPKNRYIVLIVIKYFLDTVWPKFQQLQVILFSKE